MQREIYTNTTIIKHVSPDNTSFYFFPKKTAVSEIRQMLLHGSLAVLPPHFPIS